MTDIDYINKFYTIKIIFNSIEDYDIEILLINNKTKREFYITKGKIYDKYINLAYNYIECVYDKNY